MQSVMRTIFLVVAVLLVGGLFVQVFLAGLGVFDSPDRFASHRDFGYTLELLPFLLVITGLAGRMGRLLIGLSAVMFLQFILQSILIAMRTEQPAVAALHPVNGFLILLFALVIARRAWLTRTAAATA